MAMKSRVNSWKKIQKIVCVRLDNMGDVLMTTPALRAIKETVPNSQLTLLTSRLGSKIASLIPEIDDVMICDVPWVKTYSSVPTQQSLRQLIHMLKRKQFDAAIIFTVYSQNPLPAALTCYLADIPLRLAYCHENPYYLLTHWMPDPEPNKYILHEVERQLELVKNIGYTTLHSRLSLDIPKQASSCIKKKMRASGINLTRPWLIMHPGGTEALRRYAPPGFIAAAKALRRKLSTQIIIAGSRSERALTKTVARAIGKDGYDLGGKITLAEYCALIARSSLIITNNTLPAHIGAATSTPVVDIYATTNPQHTPWQTKAKILYFDVPCRDCEWKVCAQKHGRMKVVTPQDIVKATLDLYDKR